MKVQAITKRSLSIFLRMVVVCFLLPNTDAQAGHSHGNGGEGLQIQGRIVLRDMVVDGEYQQPQVGFTVDPNISKMSTLFVFEAIGVDTSLLLRKMTDIDANLPGLGIHIYAVLLSYKWELQDLLLWLTDDDDVAPQGFQRIPVAVRGFPFLKTISVARGSWLQLTPEDRVGLLIHEAIYALQLPTCVGKNCRQDPEVTRSITRFLMTVTKENRGTLDSELIKRLNYKKTVKSEITDESANIILRSRSNEIEHLKFAGLQVSYEIQKQVTGFCRKLEQLGSDTEVELQMIRSPFCIQVLPLPSETKGASLATFYVRKAPYSQNYRFDTAQLCRSKLTTQIEFWADPGGSRAARRVYCY